MPEPNPLLPRPSDFAAWAGYRPVLRDVFAPPPTAKPSDRLLASLDPELARLLVDSGRRLKALLSIGLDRLDNSDWRVSEQRKVAVALIDVIDAGSHALRERFALPKDGAPAPIRQNPPKSDGLGGERFRILDLD